MEPIPRTVTVCQELSIIFKCRQCIMSRVVTNRGRQRFRVAVNGGSLSDDLNKTAREGIQEPVKQEHSQQQAKEQCQQQAKT